MNRYRLIAGIILGLTLTIAFSQKATAQFFMFENPLVGKEAPDFNSPTLSKSQQNMSTFRDGKMAIIFFWATWCPHCRTQLSELNKIGQALEGESIKVILVDIGEPADQVKSYLQKNNINFEVFIDKDQLIAEKYGIIGVPTFYFVNKDGIIRAVEHEIPSNFKEILNS